MTEFAAMAVEIDPVIERQVAGDRADLRQRHVLGECDVAGLDAAGVGQRGLIERDAAGDDRARVVERRLCEDDVCRGDCAGVDETRDALLTSS